MKCEHPHIVYEKGYVQAWCHTPRFVCKECGEKILPDTLLAEGTKFNSDAVLKRSSCVFREITDKDLQFISEPVDG